MRPILLALTLAIFCAAPAPAQPKCTKCRGEGFIACSGRDHDAKKHCGIDRPHMCDALLSAKCCGGLLRLACENCNQPEAVAETENLKARNAGWLEAHNKIQNETKIPFSTVETDNFTVYFAIPSWKVKDRLYNRSKGAHLFADRLEILAARFKEVTGVLPTQRQRVWLLPTPQAEMAVTLLYMGGGRSSAFKVYSVAGQLATWPNPVLGLQDDDLFHQHVVHNATHLLTQASVIFQMEFQSWFDEGMAHWMEIDLFKEPRNYCFQEINVKGPWETGDWPKRIYSEVASGKDLEMATILGKKLDQLRHREVAYGWAFMDGLIKGPGADRFHDFFAGMKRSNDAKKTLDEVLGLSTAGYQDAWKPWFTKRYGGR